MKKFIIGLLLLASCGTQRFYTDSYLIKMKDNTVDTVKHCYWQRFAMDSYKMEWMLRKEGINPDNVRDIVPYNHTFIKIKKKDL